MNHMVHAVFCMRTDEMIELGSNSELCAGFSCGSGSEMTCGREINATSKFHSANNAKNAAKVGSHAVHVGVTYCATRYPWGHEKDGDAQAQPRKVKLVGVSRVVVRCRHAHRRRDVVVEASNTQTQLEPSVASRGRNSPSADVGRNRRCSAAEQV